MKKTGMLDANKKLLRFFPFFIIIFATAAVVMSAVMFFDIRNRAAQINEFEDKRQRAFAMAEQFENGSNTMSYDAKFYCETKDIAYFRAYIEEQTEARNRDTALQALYRLGLSPREISRMQNAKIGSDRLCSREMWAMELVALSSGLTEADFPKGAATDILSDEEKALSADEQYQLGIRYIMSSAYFVSKSKLDGDVRSFSSALMQHYGQTTVEMTGVATGNTFTAFIIIIIFVLLIVLTLIIYHRHRKENEAALLSAAGKARAASASKSEFLTNMSHDIRTPMNAIVGMTDMALQSVRAGDCEEAAADLGIVKTSSRQLLSLINDVLDLSKIESGKMILAKEPYALPDVIRDVSSVILPLCIAKSQNFRVHAENLHHEFIIGDAVRCRQVLLNLLNNAYKYTPDGGNIDFYADELENPTPDTARIRFRVKDDGIGIDRAKQAQIFEAFTREVNSTVNQVEGTGLGLAIVRSILDAQGGTVTVESEKGRGSTFTVHVTVELQDEKEALERYSYLKGRKMLVLEEESGCSRKVCDMLREAGAISDCTDDLEYAARMAAGDKNLYVVALIDRGKDAADAIRKIRSAAPEQAMILLASEGNLRILESIARNAGANGILEKPLFRSVLFEKIMEVSSADRESIISIKYLTGKRILVVDDVEINRMVARVMLENNGAAVEQVGSGREAVDRFSASAEGYYDVILMDVMMPEMGGYEATWLIRALPRTDAKTIPIVAMTANAFAEDVRKSADAGMDAHIIKPMDPQAVRETLARVLRQ